MAERQTATIEVIDWDTQRIFGVGREALCEVYKTSKGWWETDWYSLMSQWEELEAGKISEIVIAEPEDVLSVRFTAPKDYSFELIDPSLTSSEAKINVEINRIAQYLPMYLYHAEVNKLSNMLFEMSGEYNLLFKRAEYRLSFPREIYAKEIKSAEIAILA